MNRLSFSFFVVTFIVLTYSSSWCADENKAWEPDAQSDKKSWQKWNAGDESQENQKKEINSNSSNKWERTNWQGRFVPQSQEKELLELLDQLDNPASDSTENIGGVSEVRRKARIARKLRKFDDCRAEDALKKLSKEDWCEDLGAGDLVCVQWSAKTSLEQVVATADLKKLIPETSLDDQKKIITKYTKRPYKNDFAIQHIKNYLVEQAATKPEFYVPLMVEHFPQDPRAEMLLRQYPQLADQSLKTILSSKDSTDVWWGINLARLLEKPEYLAQVSEIAFQGKGNIDYTNTDELEELQTMAIGYFRDFEQNAIPFYRVVLYSDFPRARDSVISGTQHLENPALLALFREFYRYQEKYSNPKNAKLIKRLQNKITLMEAAQT